MSETDVSGNTTGVHLITAIVDRRYEEGYDQRSGAEQRAAQRIKRLVAAYRRECPHAKAFVVASHHGLANVLSLAGCEPFAHGWFRTVGLIDAVASAVAEHFGLTSNDETDDEAI